MEEGRGKGWKRKEMEKEGDGKGRRWKRKEMEKEGGESYHDITPLLCHYVLEQHSFSLMMEFDQPTNLTRYHNLPHLNLESKISSTLYSSWSLTVTGLGCGGCRCWRQI